MKKRIALFLAIAMIVTLLAGCGGGTSSTPSSAPASEAGLLHSLWAQTSW